MRTVLFILLMTACTMTAGAQSLWRGRTEESSLGVQFIRPQFSSRYPEYSGVVMTISGACAVNPSTTLIAEIPFVFSSLSAPNYSFDRSALGNPYLGVQFGAPHADYFGEIGFRAPLMDDGSNLPGAVGTLSDIDRFEAYEPHIFQASAAFNIDRRIAPALRFLGRVGPSVDFRTQGSGGTNLWADYGATLVIQQEDLSLGVGYSARTLLSQGSIDDRTVNQLTLGLFFRVSNLEPGLQGRLPLDDLLHRQIDFVYAMSLRVFL